MKPKTNRARKEKEIDKDTVVAYHEFIQGRIQGELNGVRIGPGQFLFKIAAGLVIFGLICMVVGILVITLRHRHVYLSDWNAQFLGPFFIILFLLCMSAATFLLVLARRRTNQYRESLAFRPIGDYGVAVVHKSQINYDEQKKSDLKSGTTPHNVRHPGRPGVNDRGHRGDYSRSGYDNRGYKSDNNGRRRDYDEKRDRGYDDRPDRRDRDDRRPERDDRRPERDDRRGRDQPDRPRVERLRPPGPDGPDDRDRRRRQEEKRREAEGPGERGRRGDPDRQRRRPPEGERRPRPPEEERRRADARRRYEEDRRRAQLRKQAEADLAGAQSPGGERGVDVEGSKTIEVTTTVTLSGGHQGTDESEL